MRYQFDTKEDAERFEEDIRATVLDSHKEYVCVRETKENKYIIRVNTDFCPQETADRIYEKDPKCEPWYSLWEDD